MKSRWTFFFGHLVISATIALLAYLLVFHLWYPDPLDKVLDVGHIFWMMIGIDVVVGPLFTLIVYKKNWRLLRMDLGIIAFVQLCALAYAVYTVDAARPAWITFEKDRFVLVTKNEILEEENEPVSEAFVRPPLLGPGYAYVDFDRVKDQSDLLFKEVFGVKPSQYPYLYGEFDRAVPLIKEQAQPVQELQQFNQADAVQTALSAHPEADTFLPLLTTENRELTMLLNSKAENPIVSVVNLRPWE